MKYLKCLLNGRVNLHWFHHQMNPEIRLIFHKLGNRVTHVTMVIPDDKLDWYKDLLLRQYQIDSVFFSSFVTIR